MKRNEWRGLGDVLVATSLGWDLALPIFGGVLLGHLLDRRLGTTYGWTLGLLALGTITGFYNVLRSIQRVEARQRRNAMLRQSDNARAPDGGSVQGG